MKIVLINPPIKSEFEKHWAGFPILGLAYIASSIRAKGHKVILLDGKLDPRLNQDFFKNLTPRWQRNVALRTDYERRQALVEIDELVAQELGLTLDELKTIYRIQFPVLKQNEAETYYDINGRIIFTVSKGLTGVGLPRKARKTDHPCKIIIVGIEEERIIGWEDIVDLPEGKIHQTITDDTMPGGPIERTIVYKAPFAKCDREKDYEMA